jgi:hypothetical protein
MPPLGGIFYDLNAAGKSLTPQANALTQQANALTPQAKV